MLGKILLPDDSDATLNDEGTWSCPTDPSIERYLNASFDPKNPRPIDVQYPFGYLAIERAAAQLQGKPVHSNPLPPRNDNEEET